MNSITLEAIKRQFMIKGEYTIDVSRELISRFLIDFVLKYDLDIIDDPVVVRTAERTANSAFSAYGYRALVPLANSALFAYFQEKTASFIIQVYSGKAFDEADAAKYVREYFCQ